MPKPHCTQQATAHINNQQFSLSLVRANNVPHLTMQKKEGCNTQKNTKRRHN